MNTPHVWELGHTGQGIVVANADTCMEWDHSALKTHRSGFFATTVSHDYNWHAAVHRTSGKNPCGKDSAAPFDDDGHGPHITGSMVGDDGAGNQIGFAPGARWIGCPKMDRGKGHIKDSFCRPLYSADRFARFVQ